MSTPDIPSDALEQWAQHPITSKYRKQAEASVKSALHHLKDTAKSSTDPRVSRAYAYLDAAETFVNALTMPEAPDA